jgi:hypothetical protein
MANVASILQFAEAMEWWSSRLQDTPATLVLQSLNASATTVAEDAVCADLLRHSGFVGSPPQLLGAVSDTQLSQLAASARDIAQWVVPAVAADCGPLPVTMAAVEALPMEQVQGLAKKAMSLLRLKKATFEVRVAGVYLAWVFQNLETLETGPFFEQPIRLLQVLYARERFLFYELAKTTLCQRIRCRADDSTRQTVNGEDRVDVLIFCLQPQTAAAIQAQMSSALAQHAAALAAQSDGAIPALLPADLEFLDKKSLANLCQQLKLPKSGNKITLRQRIKIHFGHL